MPKPPRYIPDGAAYAAVVEEAQTLHHLQRLYWIFYVR